MNHANVPMKWRFKLFSSAFKTATLLDGLHVIELDGKSDTRFKHWCGTNPRFIEHLRTWGKVGTVNLKDLGTPKVADRGIQCTMVGYTTDHISGCYEMWDPATGRIHTTRYIIWLKSMYFPRISVTPPVDGNDIQVAIITFQYSCIKAEEGIPIVDFETTEVDTVHEVETVHKEETEELE